MPDKIKQEFNRVMADRATKALLGAALVEKLQIRARTGRGADTSGGSPKKFPGLAQPTKDYRKRYRGNLASTTTPARSNVTATGQLLEAMRSKVSGSAIILYFISRRTKRLTDGLTTINRKRTKPLPSNQEVLKELDKKGFSFFNLAKQDFNFIGRELRNEIRKRFRSIR